MTIMPMQYTKDIELTGEELAEALKHDAYINFEK